MELDKELRNDRKQQQPHVGKFMVHSNGRPVVFYSLISRWTFDDIKVATKGHANKNAQVSTLLWIYTLKPMKVLTSNQVL